jgi:hypothetical protein
MEYGLFLFMADVLWRLLQHSAVRVKTITGHIFITADALRIGADQGR